jgi:poly-gamma-glutamate synthesis protein (capsule biosynthesis protein)
MRSILAFLTFLLLPVFAGAGTDLSVDAQGGLWNDWETLVARHPLPSGVTVWPASPNAAMKETTVTLRIGKAAGYKVVARFFVAPVARMWEADAAPTLGEVQAGAFRTARLEDVALPDIALPVDGRYPDEPGYPLHEELSVMLEGGTPALKEWFASLPDGSAGSAVARIAWVGAVGDVMPARGVDEVLLGSRGAERVFGDALAVLGTCGLVLGNLEAAATRGGTRTAKTYTFRFNPEALGVLRLAGFSYFSLANNHTFDFGRQGFLDTLENLSRWGIATSGAGRSEQEAARPFAGSVGGAEVRVLSFGAYPVDRTGFDGRAVARAAGEAPGTLWLDDVGLAAARSAFSTRTFDIALVHGGQEWSTLPLAEQRRRYRNLVDAGADMVLGSHPHVLQGMEVYAGRLIAYSLGNFLFPGMDGTDGGEDSVILKMGIYAGKTRFLRAFPVRLAGGTVRLDAGVAVLRSFLSRTRLLSQGK